MKLNLAQEIIDFQKDNFGKKLEVIMQEAIDFCIEEERKYNIYPEPDNNIIIDQASLHVREELHKSNISKKFKDIIFTRLGLNVDIFLNIANFNASVIPLWVNNNNILIQKLYRGSFMLDDQKKFLNDVLINNKKGNVNLKTAKISGAFSNYNHLCQIDIYGLFRGVGITAEELTAILLHELGHAFTAIEYSDRLESTNQVIATIASNIKENNQKDYPIIFKELKQRMGLTDEEISNLEKEKNKTILGIRLFKAYAKFVKSQMPVDYHDDRSSEQLADSFASRFGYGREFVTFENKLSKLVGHTSVSRSSRIMTNIFVVLMYSIISVIIVSGLISGFYFVPFVYSLLAGLIFSGSNPYSEYKMHSYDTTKDRYKRIRNDYVEMIKSLKLNNEELRKIIDNVDFLDNIIKETVNYRSPAEKLYLFISKKSRNIKEDIEIQQMMESLASNDIFLRSAELKTLGN